MKSDNKCPGCTQALQPFPVPIPSGAELELHRCTHCGGSWGAGGCIQRSFGPSARHQLIGGLTERNCVECRILMTPAVLPSDISVEVCSACHGMFLDAGELARLGVRENSRAPAPSEEPESFSLEVSPPVETAGTFECIACGKRKPLREGQALRDGLACRACMKARVEGSDTGDSGLGKLFRGRPRS